jgi:hypothetical protein
VPVSVKRPAVVSAAINLRGERGSLVTLPGEGPAAWLAELLRAL